MERNVVASQALLDARGVETVPSDRGGDVTFHGPGQLVVYPIVRLNDHRLSVGGYVRALERAVIDALAGFDVAARKDDCAVGVWAEYGTYVSGEYRERLAVISAKSVTRRHVAEETAVRWPLAISSFAQVAELAGGVPAPPRARPRRARPGRSRRRTSRA